MGLCESKTKKIDSKGTNKKIFLGNNDGKDNILYNINSKYILSHLMANLSQRKLLQMVNYNKKLQNQINIGLNNYKEYSQIEIEIKVIPIKAEPKKKFIYDGKYDPFNPFKNDKYYKCSNAKEHYHIYFDDNKEEIKKNYYIKED